MDLSNETFEAAAQSAGVEVYDDYSGRGMFGARCTGVTGSRAEVQRFYIEVATRDAEMAKALGDRERTDSLGMGMIAYWPGVVFV